MKTAILDKNNQIIECVIETYLKTGITSIARYEKDSILVSTVFLGLQHNNKWFETMVFSDDLPDGSQIRTSTYEQAIHKHNEIVGRMLCNPLNPTAVSYSTQQLIFLGEHACTREKLSVVDQFTFEMLG